MMFDVQKFQKLGNVLLQGCDVKVSFVCFICFFLLVLLLFCSRIFSRNSLFFFILQEYSIEHCVAFSTWFTKHKLSTLKGQRTQKGAKSDVVTCRKWLNDGPKK